jgi:disulfide bond formation protein DsbB
MPVPAHSLPNTKVPANADPMNAVIRPQSRLLRYVVMLLGATTVLYVHWLRGWAGEHPTTTDCPAMAEPDPEWVWAKVGCACGVHGITLMSVVDYTRENLVVGALLREQGMCSVHCEFLGQLQLCGL